MNCSIIIQLSKHTRRETAKKILQTTSSNKLENKFKKINPKSAAKTSAIGLKSTRSLKTRYIFVFSFLLCVLSMWKEAEESSE